ncbi:MAG: acyl-CoA dehydrogenase family protein [Sphingopyxis sp.]|nr:acyl-CoA dehydrogenase family protein [Sphingopyxis sp.]
MDFALNDEQQMLSDSVARFVQSEYGFEARTRLVVAGEGGSPANWRTFAENGWLAAAFPDEFGGFGGGAIENAVIAEQFGRGLVIESWLGCAVLAAQTLAASGDAASKAEWLPSLADGSRRLALAWSEPESRGVPHIVGTRATGQAGGYRLSGRKTLVLGGCGADALLVSARSEGAIGDRAGIGLFLVEAGAAGLSVLPAPLHDGSLAATVILNDAPARMVAGDGLAALEHGIAHAMLALSAELVGAMGQSIEITADYVRTRKQFGVTIGSFQSLQHRLADMAAEMELARSMLFAALAAFENDDAATRRVAIAGAKAFVTEAARNVCGQGIQLHGGIGMTDECAIGHYFKRAIVADALFGTRSVHAAACAEALAADLDTQGGAEGVSGKEEREFA